MVTIASANIAPARFTSDSSASDGTNTTINESLCIVIVQGDTPDCMRSTDPRLLSVTTDRVISNRKSSEAVHIAKYKENVNGDETVRHSGLGYTWPIDAKKKTYQFFAPDLEKAYPAVYKGTSKLKGLTVYEYVCDAGTQPYQVQGLFPGTYTDTRTVWVEPKTGVIIKGSEHQVQAFTNGQVALDTTLTFDQKAQTFEANYAKDKIKTLRLAQIWGPIVMGLLGVLALAGGVVLLRAGRGSGGDSDGGRRHGTPDNTPAYEDEAPVNSGNSQT